MKHALTTHQVPNVDTIVINSDHAVVCFKNGQAPHRLSADNLIDLLLLLEWYLIPTTANKDVQTLAQYNAGSEDTQVLKLD